MHLADERDRLADERDARADQRDRLADERDARADERDRLADERESRADDRERLAEQRDNEANRLRSEAEGLSRLAEEAKARSRTRHAERLAVAGSLARQRAAAADIAESMANEAEAFAAVLEGNPMERGRERRLRIAAAEREIAGIARRNAARLRTAGPGLPALEHIPSLPLADEPEPDGP
ncbi:MAG TPA: hypothetical protein VFJ85_14905 [Acidimicrobiales bacterium]|nr:hypothetical protein [Acidimicrobiales bacterium]